MNNKNTTYNKITAKIILSMLVLTLLSAIVYSKYIKDEVIQSLAKIDARKTSKLVFESMYSAMQKGWNKDEISEVITRLNKVDDKLEINIHRGVKVAEIFGDIDLDKKVRERDKNIIEAFKGDEILDMDDMEIIKYYFPLISNSQCQTCHINTKDGDVLGVININYPITDLKVSLNDIINMFLLFIILFTVILFVLLFINFNKYLVKPMENFIHTANIIKKSSDISQRVKLENNINEIESMQNMFNSMLDSIEFQFYYDPLTNLKNRRALLEDLEKHKNILLMIINLDKFQQINNLYGNEIGDKILVDISTKLKEILPKTAVVYKMHADEFSVITKSSIDLAEFENIASLIISTLSKCEFKVDGDRSIFINATIGIAHGSSLLLANADMALKIAKKRKKDFLTYTEDMLALKEYENRLNWTKRLNEAIDNDKIVPFYQPIVDCKTNEVVKYEALMRIRESEDDYIVPVHFLDISKENKLYFKLTLIMLEKIFDMCKKTNKVFSINLNKDDMTNDKVTNFIYQEFEKVNFAHNISFEILESEGIENFDEIESFIVKVKKYGATISIDDFGTGYSNFEYLLKLNFDFLKIDASMIKDIDKNEKSQMITKTIVDISKKMGVKTIAEFVSSKAIFDKVDQLGIDYAQGYYLGEPTQNIDID